MAAQQVEKMRIMKYVIALLSLFIGFVIIALKDAYQNLMLTLVCSAIYKIGPNAGCDTLLGLPDFGFLFLFLGIIGILVSAYADCQV